MRMFVTGGAGFVGSHLCDILLDDGHEVVVFDNLSSGKIDFLNEKIVSQKSSLSLIKGDLLILDEVEHAIKGAEIVWHLAANPDIRLGTEVTDTDLKQGTFATYNVLEAMRKNGIKKIAFASSSVVYGEAKQMPTPEDYGPLFPISLYGASKLASEGLISSWVGTFGLQAWIFRFANIIGARGTHGVIFDFINKLKQDSTTLEVLGNGLQEKSYMEVTDCVRAMNHLVMTEESPINYFNLGSGDTCSVSRIAEIVVKASNLEHVEIKYTGGERGWAGDVSKAMLSTSRLDSTGFESNYTSEEAVLHTAQCLMKELRLHD